MSDRSLTDILTVELPVLGPKTTATEGEPVESLLSLHKDELVSIGVWECTPGSFPSARNGVTETMTFLAGRGTIFDEDGTAHPVGPGVLMVLGDGWKGRWEITETLRKTYTITTTR